MVDPHHRGWAFGDADRGAPRLGNPSALSVVKVPGEHAGTRAARAAKQRWLSSYDFRWGDDAGHDRPRLFLRIRRAAPAHRILIGVPGVFLAATRGVGRVVRTASPHRVVVRVAALRGQRSEFAESASKVADHRLRILGVRFQLQGRSSHFRRVCTATRVPLLIWDNAPSTPPHVR